MIELPKAFRWGITRYEMLGYMKAKSASYWALFGILVFALGCGDQEAPTQVASEGANLPIRLSLGKVAASQVARVELVVTDGDEVLVREQLAIRAGVVEGSVIVTVGVGRLFTINAYDASGDLIYSGSATADVLPGGGTVVPPISVKSVNAESTLPAQKSLVFPGNSGIDYVGKEEVEFVLVPGGPFIMGSDYGAVQNGPQRVIDLDAFYIGKYEITTEQFLAFIRLVGINEVPTYYKSWDGIVTYSSSHYYYNDSKISYRTISGNYIIDVENYPDAPTQPVGQVSWYGAKLYCEMLGARLPSNAEWEKAARGTDGRTFPWGNQIAGGEANTAISQGSSTCCGFAPVGSFEGDKSPYGAMDMSGNVREWVADWFDPSYYVWSPSKNPLGPKGAIDSRSVNLRGGYAQSNQAILTTTYSRTQRNPNEPGGEIGFRCACDP